MNELDEIRHLLPEQPPPSDRLVADVRARLTGAPAPAPRRSRVLVPLAAAAAVVAAAVISLPGNDSPPATEQVSAKNILLTAADQLAAEAAETGRFWRTRILMNFDDSTNLPRTVTETWLSGDGHEPDWRGTRHIEPLDEGSVAELPLGNQILPGVTAEVDALPTDAAALRTFLLDRWENPWTGPNAVDEYLFACAVKLLAEVPATPGTRAAALRLIAELGGVESTGPVTDPLGREGTGVRLTDRYGDLEVTTEIVLDATNGTLLSIRYIANQPVKNYYVAVLASGWTDETPGVPSPEVP